MKASVAIALLLAGLVSAAPLPDPKRAVKEPLDELLERIEMIAAGTEWRKPGWRDPVLEAALARLRAEVGGAIRRNDLQFPVGFGKLLPAEIEVPAPPVVVGGNKAAVAVGFGQHLTPSQFTNALVVLKENASLNSAEKSIVLSSGSVRFGTVTDCIIVARDTVEVSRGQNSVILAGQFLSMMSENVPAAGPAQGQPGANALTSGNLLLCGNILQMYLARGTICSAANHLRIDAAYDATFLKSPRVAVRYEKNCARLPGAAVTLTPRPRRSPLDGKLKITQVVSDADARRSFAVLDQGGVETVLRAGARIADRDGQPIAELEGWSLRQVADRFALFRNGTQRAGLFVDDPNPSTAISLPASR